MDSIYGRQHMDYTEYVGIRDLRKSFGNLTAVDGISFDIRKGEIFGFLGPNGAGKTTTILMLCGLMEPSGGIIRFHDEVGEYPRKRIGFCPQENIFWPKLTCREQLIFMGRMYGMKGVFLKRRSDELLKIMGLSAKSGVLASRLSGGMRRRLSICLAMVHDPPILVLDEPEAGLDPQSRILVREVIRQQSSDKTVILTTHNMDEADRMASRVAIIDHGRLLMLDAPANLKKHFGAGDILEVSTGLEEGSDLSGLKSLLESLGISLLHHDGNLLLRSRDLVSRIPAVVHCFEQSNIAIRELTLRENTLEDVFIHLTGRKLRQ
ncbi:MAG: ABC transporter ATP-binding protein [Bacteroidales bacterium]|nr:ABC transporter ATP-binding protein [Bacteroidales bacterium]